MPLNFVNEFLIPLQNDPKRRTNISPGPIRLHRIPFSTSPILLHRVPLSLMTFSSSPILLLCIHFSYSDKINEFLILLQYDPTTYFLVNEICQTNLSTGPLRLYRVPFSTGPILLIRVPFTAGYLLCYAIFPHLCHQLHHFQRK